MKDIRLRIDTCAGGTNTIAHLLRRGPEAPAKTGQNKKKQTGAKSYDGDDPFG